MIKNFNKDMEIPSTLKEYGIPEDKFNEVVDLISERAILDACTGANPRTINKEEMKKLFTCSYYGTEVDF